MRILLSALLASASLLVGGGSIAAPASPHAGVAASPESANIPQPHLAAALRLASQENSWRHPALVACYPRQGQASQNVNMNPPGTKIFDNLYYVGNGKYGPYAIDTDQGIILIDAMNSPSDVERVIIPNMREAGLDPDRLKVLILSHGHADHYGGSSYLIDKYHVRVYMTAADYAFADEQWKQIQAKGNPRHQGPPPKKDQVATDGGTIRLGDEVIRTFITPGHTPGTLTMLIPVTEHGKPHLLVYLGGTTSKGLSPAMHAAYDRSYARLATLLAHDRPDGLIAAHPNYDDAVYNIEYMRSNPTLPNPFLAGVQDIVRQMKIYRECNLNNELIEKSHPYDKQAGYTPQTGH